MNKVVVAIAFLLIAHIGFPAFVSGQEISEQGTAVQEGQLTVLETAVSTSIDPTDEMEQYYIEMLEKTNAQMSLWYNPYGLMIGSLGVLFAMLGIATAILLFFQSGDYKRQREEDRKTNKNEMEKQLQAHAGLIDAQLESNRSAVAAFLEEQKKYIDEIRQKFDQLISQYKKQLKNVRADQREQIQKEIAKLESERDLLSSRFVSGGAGWGTANETLTGRRPTTFTDFMGASGASGGGGTGSAGDSGAGAPKSLGGMGTYNGNAFYASGPRACANCGGPVYLSEPFINRGPIQGIDEYARLLCVACKERLP